MSCNKYDKNLRSLMYKEFIKADNKSIKNTTLKKLPGSGRDKNVSDAPGKSNQYSTFFYINPMKHNSLNTSHFLSLCPPR